MDIDHVVELGRALQEQGYGFTTVTPETHRRVIERPRAPGADPLRDLFGWNRVIDANELSPVVLRAAEKAGVIARDTAGIKSLIRFSTLDGAIFAHSAFPTEQEDSVFFGPDSYRFVNFIKRKITGAEKILDLGCGSGVGGLSLARHLHQRGKDIHALILADVSARALEFSRANCALAGAGPACRTEHLCSDLFNDIAVQADTVIANPPFIADTHRRRYRDGGDQHGSQLSVRIFQKALEYLPTGGQLALYTGTAVVNGRDVFYDGIESSLRGLEHSYEELDPDIFGEELSGENYAAVERIAAVGLYLRK